MAFRASKRRVMRSHPDQIRVVQQREIEQGAIGFDSVTLQQLARCRERILHGITHACPAARRSADRRSHRPISATLARPADDRADPRYHACDLFDFDGTIGATPDAPDIAAHLNGNGHLEERV
jgi:hypothetical protein